MIDLIASNYAEFPNADTITRRLKKLVQTIVKFEQNDGKLDFDTIVNNIDENELDGYFKLILLLLYHKIVDGHQQKRKNCMLSCLNMEFP